VASGFLFLIANVRCPPESGHVQCTSACPPCAISDILHRGKVGQIQRAILLSGAFDPHVDFAAKRPEVDRLGEQGLGTTL
jgi:hypothetical protein